MKMESSIENWSQEELDQVGHEVAKVWLESYSHFNLIQEGWKCSLGTIDFIVESNSEFAGVFVTSSIGKKTEFEAVSKDVLAHYKALLP